VDTNLSHDHLDYHPTLQNTEMLKNRFLTTCQNSICFIYIDKMAVMLQNKGSQNAVML
jgi:UDP-N-acetylmuramyl tripeptide synthase